MNLLRFGGHSEATQRMFLIRRKERKYTLDGNNGMKSTESKMISLPFLILAWFYNHKRTLRTDQNNTTKQSTATSSILNSQIVTINLFTVLGRWRSTSMNVLYNANCIMQCTISTIRLCSTFWKTAFFRLPFSSKMQTACQQQKHNQW